MNELNVGDVYYKVDDKHNSFWRKKEIRVIDGEEWFRYETPRASYEIKTYTILGVLHKQLEGEWDNSESYDLETQWYVKCVESGDSFTTDTNLEKNHEFFVNRSDAMDYIEQKLAEDKQKDR